MHVKHQMRRKGREIFLHPLMEPSTMAFELPGGIGRFFFFVPFARQRGSVIIAGKHYAI